MGKQNEVEVMSVAKWVLVVEDASMASGDKTRCFAAASVPPEKPRDVTRGWWLSAIGVYLVEVDDPDQVTDEMLESWGFSGIEWPEE